FFQRLGRTLNHRGGWRKALSQLGKAFRKLGKRLSRRSPAALNRSESRAPTHLTTRITAPTNAAPTTPSSPAATPPRRPSSQIPDVGSPIHPPSQPPRRRVNQDCILPQPRTHPIPPERVGQD